MPYGRQIGGGEPAIAAVTVVAAVIGMALRSALLIERVDDFQSQCTGNGSGIAVFRSEAVQHGFAVGLVVGDVQRSAAVSVMGWAAALSVLSSGGVARKLWEPEISRIASRGFEHLLV